MQPQVPTIIELMPLIIWFLIGIPLAFGNAFLARRVGKSGVLWVILSLIPFVNLIFLYYVGYIVVFRVLDRLRDIADRLDGMRQA